MITSSLIGVQGNPRVQLSSAGDRQGKPGLDRHSPLKEGGQGERESQQLCASQDKRKKEMAFICVRANWAELVFKGHGTRARDVIKR